MAQIPENFRRKHSRIPFKKALITGGAGFVGSHLADKLLSEGIETRILDNLSSGFKENVPSEAILFRGDVRDKEIIRTAANDVDVIYHLAEFIPNIEGHVIRFSSEKPKEDLDVCVGGTINALDEARRNNCHFVLASTAAVYGNKKDPVSEGSELQPISPYGAAKLCAEVYTQMYRRTFGVHVTILRFFNVFGPRQRKYLMYDFLSKLKLDPRRVELYGNGKEIRDYISVKDIVELIVSIPDRPNLDNDEDDSSSIFNLGSGVGRTTAQIVDKLAQISNLKPEIVYLGDTWPGNIRQIVADPSRVKTYSENIGTDFESSLAELASSFWNKK